MDTGKHLLLIVEICLIVYRDHTFYILFFVKYKMIVIGIEVSDGLSANSQESIVMANNRKAREAISTILHKKNGCLTSVSLIEHRFCYTLPLY